MGLTSRRVADCVEGFSFDRFSSAGLEFLEALTLEIGEFVLFPHAHLDCCKSFSDFDDLILKV